MAQLPRHLYKGRNNVVGPACGYYFHVNLGPLQVGINEPNTTKLSFRAPMDMRLMKMVFGCQISLSTDVTVTLKKHSSVVGGAGVAMSTATDIALVDANIGTFGYAGTEDVALLDTSAGERNVSKGEWVFLDIVSDGTGGATNLCFTLIFWVTGHPNSSEGSD